MRGLRFALGCAVATTVAAVLVGPAVADRLPGSDQGGLPQSATLVGANQVPPVATAGSGTPISLSTPATTNSASRSRSRI